jgi:hypothetical protein
MDGFCKAGRERVKYGSRIWRYRTEQLIDRQRAGGRKILPGESFVWVPDGAKPVLISVWAGRVGRIRRKDELFDHTRIWQVGLNQVM